MCAADLGRAALLPIRALERLHAFVCLLVFDAFGAPEEAGLELVVSALVSQPLGGCGACFCIAEAGVRHW